ncbi:MAG: hypothetical protein ACMUIU_01360 [bacterium]
MNCIPELKPIDSLFQMESLWYKTELWETPRNQLLAEAVNWHIEQCPLYRTLYKKAEVDSEKILENGPKGIELLPIRGFKHFGDQLTSVSEQEKISVFESSGTMGKTSQVMRDELSISRLLGSVELGVRNIANTFEDSTVILIGPDLENAGNVWFSYVMALVELLYPTISVINGDLINFVLAYDLLSDPSFGPKVIVGVPPVIWDVMQGAIENKVNFNNVTHIITGGGWKRRSGEEVSFQVLNETANKCSKKNKIKICDTFNMVEMNTVLFKCEADYFHTPPWLVLEALDPYNLQPVPPNIPGILAFYDASSRSYPGFILTEDVIALAPPESCTCGRAGERMRFIRRVRNSENRGCAKKIDKIVTKGV